ncbi:MAG: hypothetical protein KDI02_05870 [Anaerolineae bacterium]|nr:hypothetical protein [Anaerolineae bacterium]MCB0223195.1 hypothetical protein [Anaerolineae bacterium]
MRFEVEGEDAYERYNSYEIPPGNGGQPDASAYGRGGKMPSLSLSLLKLTIDY